MSFREAEPMEWNIGTARIRAQPVNHRGPTLGYRIQEGDDSLCYIPDHEPGLGTPMSALEDEWISGFDLAHDCTLLIHDCQYTDDEYPNHLGWGHAPMSDALEFARRVAAERLLLFHHDPLHTDDFLDDLYTRILSRWEELGGRPDQVELASERLELEVSASSAGARSAAPGSPVRTAR
jgi:ribonuclease BN (tRNA processing enzyme)